MFYGIQAVNVVDWSGQHFVYIKGSTVFKHSYSGLKGKKKGGDFNLAEYYLYMQHEALSTECKCILPYFIQLYIVY